MAFLRPFRGFHILPLEILGAPRSPQSSPRRGGRREGEVRRRLAPRTPPIVARVGGSVLLLALRIGWSWCACWLRLLVADVYGCLYLCHAYLMHGSWHGT